MRLWLHCFDLFLVGVNAVTGGNYGLMTHPPLIKGDRIWVNYTCLTGSGHRFAPFEYFKGDGKAIKISLL